MSFTLLPSAGKLRGVVRVREERNLWIGGTLWDNPSVVIEISFESAPRATLPGTSVSYLGIWRPGRRGCIFEFQMGVIVHRPTEEDWQEIISPILQRLNGYRPINVA